MQTPSRSARAGRASIAAVAAIVVATVVGSGQRSAATDLDVVALAAVSTEVDDTLILSLADDGRARLVGSGGSMAIVTLPTSASEPGLAPRPLIIEGRGGDDTLVVDFTNGNPVPPDGLVYLGGGQRPDGQGDALELVGGVSDTVAHRFVNAHDGAIDFDIDGRATRIEYRGLEPIVDNVIAADRTFTFTGGSEVIQLRNGGPLGQSFIDSDLAEEVTFANPTDSLTVVSQNGLDQVFIQGIDTQFGADLIITGDSDDLISFDTSSLDIEFGALTVTGARVDFDSDVRAGGGFDVDAAGSIFVAAGVDLDANGPIRMTADTAAAGTGAFFMAPTASMNGLAAAIDIEAGADVTIADIETTPANLTPLTAQSTTGDVILAGSIGVASISAQAGGDVSVIGAVSTGGAVSFDAGVDIDIEPLGTQTQITGLGPVSFTAGGAVTVGQFGLLSVPRPAISGASLRIGGAGLGVPNGIDVDVVGLVEITDGGLGVGDLDVEAGSLLVRGGGMSATGRADLTIDGTTTVQDAGAQIGEGMTLSSGSVEIRGNGLASIGSEPASITTQGDLVVRGTGLSASGPLLLNVGGSLDSGDGGINTTPGSGDVDVVVGAGAQMAGAGVRSRGAVSFDIDDDLLLVDNGLDAADGDGDVSITVGGVATIRDAGIDGTARIDVTVAGDLSIDGISTTSPLTDAVRLTSTNGSILNAELIAIPSGFSNVEAPTGGVVFTATGAGGGIGVAGGTSAEPAIQTAVAHLSATSSGDIDIVELDAVSSLDLTALASSVRFEADGAVRDADGDVDVAGADATIVTTGSLGAAGAPIQTALGSLEATSIGAAFLAEADVVTVPAFDNGGSAVSLAGGAFAVTGTVSSPTLLTGGILAGSGTIAGEVTSSGAGGGIAPGASPGIVTVDGDLTLDSTTAFDVEIDGASPGAEFDQLRVRGAARTVTLDDAELRLDVADSATIDIGDTFVIIDVVASTSAVVGTFADRPESSIAPVGDRSFSISYVGGDGNDVELTAVDPVAAIVPVDPARFADTRADVGTIDDLFAGDGKLAAGQEYRVRIAGRGDVPADAVGVVVNVTAIQAEAIGFVTAHPCTNPRPLTSSLNYAAGVNLGNEVIVGLDDDGFVCLFSSASIHLSADVVGFVPLGAPLTNVVPARVLDTRESPTIDGRFQGDGRTTAGGTTIVRLAGRHTVPESARTVIVNVTAVRPTQRGFVTVSACLDPIPTASSLNYEPGVTRGNELIATLDASGDLCLFTSSSIDLTIDVMGYVDDTPTFSSTPPARLLDTRPGFGTIDGLGDLNERPVAGSRTVLQVAGRGAIPADARGVVVNVTAIQASGVGFVTVDPCGDTVPVASSLNFVAGANGGNEVVARVSDLGQLCLFSSASAHLVVDVVAYLPA